MRKLQIVMISLCVTVVLKAQQMPSELLFPQAIPMHSKVKYKAQHKAYADTLYYQDFDSLGTGGLPMGWISTDFTGNGFHWIWSDSAPGGQFSTAVGPLQSNTSSNGYLLLPSDLYNTGVTGGPIAMDAQVTSPVIHLSAKPYVNLEFDYFYRYCCGLSVSLLVVEVSADSTNWTAFDITKGRSQSAVTPNAEHFKVDVSSVLANQNKAYIRFKQRGAAYYFYMVDDVMLTEGAAADLVMTYSEMTFPTGHQFEPVYSMIPCNLNYDVHLDFYGVNLNPNIRTGVMGNLEVIEDSKLNGSAGSGQVYQSQLPNSRHLMNSQMTDTFSFSVPLSFNGPFFNGGNYSIIPSIDSDSMSNHPSYAKDTFHLRAQDTILAKDFNNFTAQMSTTDFTAGGQNGDRFASLYNIDRRNTSYFTSVSVFISNDTQNVGIGIQPRIWEFDETQGALNQAFLHPLLGSSPFTRVIGMSDLGKWVALPLFPPFSANDSTQYMVGVEQMSRTDSNRALTIGVDMSAQNNVTPVSNLIYTQSDTSWRWFNQMVGIRLNEGWICLRTNIENDENLNQAFDLYPNPSYGQFTLDLKTNIRSNGQIQIRTIQGQLIYEQQIRASSSQIELGDLPSGIYLISIQNGEDLFHQKIVIE